MSSEKIYKFKLFRWSKTVEKQYIQMGGYNTKFSFYFCPDTCTLV